MFKFCPFGKSCHSALCMKLLPDLAVPEVFVLRGLLSCLVIVSHIYFILLLLRIFGVSCLKLNHHYVFVYRTWTAMLRRLWSFYNVWPGFLNNKQQKIFSCFFISNDLFNPGLPQVSDPELFLLLSHQKREKWNSLREVTTYVGDTVCSCL